VIIVVCVVCGVVFLLICVCVIVFFVLKAKTSSQSNELKSFSHSSTPLRFDEDVGMTESSDHPILSRYSECSVTSLFSVSTETLTLTSSGSPLKVSVVLILTMSA
jgi:hypothetical protein